MRSPALFLFVALLTLPASGQPVTLAPEIPEVGQEATIRLAEPADYVVVTYRPNSIIAQRDTIRIGGFDSVKWTPKRAGVVRIGLPDGGGQNVSVQFTGVPLSGLLILIFAGLILFGGAVFAMRKLLEDDAPLVMPEDMPDT